LLTQYVRLFMIISLYLLFVNTSIQPTTVGVIKCMWFWFVILWPFIRLFLFVVKLIFYSGESVILDLLIRCTKTRFKFPYWDIKMLGTREKLDEYIASMAKPIDVYSFWISIGIWGIQMLNILINYVILSKSDLVFFVL
jgi:hypothetical protein